MIDGARSRLKFSIELIVLPFKVGTISFRVEPTLITCDYFAKNSCTQLFDDHLLVILFLPGFAATVLWQSGFRTPLEDQQKNKHPTNPRDPPAGIRYPHHNYILYCSILSLVHCRINKCTLFPHESLQRLMFPLRALRLCVRLSAGYCTF